MRLRGGERCANLVLRMARSDRRSIWVVLAEARHALGMTQRDFGSALGASHRSAVRWDAQQSVPAQESLRRLARLVYPQSRDLAAEVARAADATLVELGLEASPPPAQHATPVARIEDLVDVLVLVAVENSGASPADARRWLHAVFARGSALGVSMADAERALRPVEESSDGKRAPKGEAPARARVSRVAREG
jgi:transcriptional regulator with XRE-family HTH domain